MKIVKKGFIEVPTQPVADNLKVTGIVFKSYDKEIALELHIAKQDGKPADLLGANVRLLMNIYEEADGVVTKDPVPFIASNLITESYLNGVVKYILPDSLKAYNGTVETFVYVDYPDNSSSDNIGFTFRMEKSKIDKIASGKAEYFIQDFKALLAEVNLQVDEFSANVTELQNEVKTIGNEVKAIENEVKSLTKLQALYSNSLDFGDYDYSGRANLMPNLDFSKLSGTNYMIQTPPPYIKDGGTYFVLDASDASAANTPRNVFIPFLGRLEKGATYIVTIPMMISEDFGTDYGASAVYPYDVNDGATTTRTLTMTPNADCRGKWQFISKAFTVPSNVADGKFAPYLHVHQNANQTGKLYIGYDIKIEKVNSTSDTATPYQPNLLDAPYYLSKVALGENIKDKGTVFPIKTSAHAVYNGVNTEPYIAGQKYTLTMKATKPATQTFNVYLNFGTIGVGSMTPVEGLTDVWQKTFTVSQAHIDAGVTAKLVIYQASSSPIGTVNIDWLKIEKGDTRTPNIERHRYKGLALLGTTEPTKYEWELSLQGEEEDLDAAKAYTDKQVQTVTTAANSYTDTAKTEAINSANKYADARKTEAINSANKYADARKTEAVNEAGTQAQNKVTALENKLTAISHLELNITNGNTGSCHLYRQGKIVTLYFQNLCGKSSGGVDSKIADLPEGSFPPVTFEQLVGSTDRSTLNSATIEITSSGTIWWKRNTAFSSGYTFIVTYVLG